MKYDGGIAGKNQRRNRECGDAHDFTRPDGTSAVRDTQETSKEL